MTVTVSSAFVVPLGAVGAGDVALVGGKGANLSELVRAGFAVPAGFVVTTRLYREALRAAGLDPGAAVFDASGAGRLESAIAALELPSALTAPLVDAYRALGEGPVAVRSSATAEDLPGAAFAGQQETSLNVIGTQALLSLLGGPAWHIDWVATAGAAAVFALTIGAASLGPAWRAIRLQPSTVLHQD